MAASAVDVAAVSRRRRIQTAATTAQRWIGRCRRELTVVGVGGVAFVLALILVGVSNIAFHLAASRLLGPADYGALGSLLAILTALSVPATAFETLVTAWVARRLERGERVDGFAMIGRALAVGAGGAAVLLATAPLLKDSLHLGSATPLMWLALYLLPLSGSVVPWGLACGQRRFGQAGAVALGGALTRVGLAVLFMSAGFGVAGAIAASVCADTLRAVGLTAVSRVRAINHGAPSAAPLGVRRALGGALAFGGLWLLIGVDTVLARHLFSPVVAGQYAAAATASRATFLVSQAICLLAVPRFATTDPRRARFALRVTVLCTIGFGLVATAGLVWTAPWLPVVFGQGFDVTPTLLALLGFAATALSLLWLLVQYHLARGSRGAGAAWWGLGTAAVGVLLWGNGPDNLAAIMILAAVVALTVSVWYAVRGEHRAVRPSMTDPLPLAVTPPDAVDLTVVVPHHNAGHRLRRTLLNLLDALRQARVSFEVVTVADGCTDGSPETIADLDPRLVRQYALPRNQGKGAALRLGLQVGRGRYLGFIDADGDLDPQLWQPFLGLVRLYRPDAVVGSKCHPLSTVDPGAGQNRRIWSLGYRVLVRLMYPTLPVAETQVGIKLFRRELLADVLPRSVERGFVFDLEVLAVAHRLGYRRIMPAPVTLRRVGSSTISVRMVCRMFADTVALAWRLVVCGAYDDRRPEPDTWLTRVGLPAWPVPAQAAPRQVAKPEFTEA